MAGGLYRGRITSPTNLALSAVAWLCQLWLPNTTSAGLLVTSDSTYQRLPSGNGRAKLHCLQADTNWASRHCWEGSVGSVSRSVWNKGAVIQRLLVPACLDTMAYTAPRPSPGIRAVLVYPIIRPPLSLPAKPKTA